MPTFHGDSYDPQHDYDRLSSLRAKVHHFLISTAGPDGVSCRWVTPEEIAEACHIPLTADIQRRLRDIRKPECGGYRLEKRRRGDPSAGLFEYRINGRQAAQDEINDEAQGEDFDEEILQMIRVRWPEPRPPRVTQILQTIVNLDREESDDDDMYCLLGNV